MREAEAVRRLDTARDRLQMTVPLPPVEWVPADPEIVLGEVAGHLDECRRLLRLLHAPSERAVQHRRIFQRELGGSE